MKTARRMRKQERQGAGDQMRSNTRETTAFTHIEFMVLAAALAVMALLLLPVLSKARERSRAATCANQLKQWGVAFQMYAADYHGWLFTTKHWESTEFIEGGHKKANVYARYLGGASSDKIVQLRNCPEVLKTTSVAKLKADNRYGYSMNWPNVKGPEGYQLAPADSYGGASYRLDKIPKPAEFLLLVDTDGSYYRVKSAELKGMVSSILDRHSGSVNVLFADQHVELIPFETLAARAALPVNQNTWFQAN